MNKIFALCTYINSVSCCVCPCSLRKENASICVNTKELKCDVGNLPSVFGCYTFQVRAEDQGLFSEWVNANEFLPNKHSKCESALSLHYRHCCVFKLI